MTDRYVCVTDRYVCMTDSYVCVRQTGVHAADRCAVYLFQGVGHGGGVVRAVLVTCPIRLLPVEGRKRHSFHLDDRWDGGMDTETQTHRHNARLWFSRNNKIYADLLIT